MTHTFTVPPALNRGGKIGVIRPGNGPAKTEFPHVYNLGLERLQTVFDVAPVEFPSCDMTCQELTENPEARAQDVMDAFKDPEINGVLAAIGGDGHQHRIIEHLDPDVIRNNPTRFYGVSDNTSLQLYLWNQGIVSFYGPALMTQLAMNGAMHDYTVQHVERVFFEKALGEIRPADRFTDENLDWADPENLEKHREMEDNPGWTWTHTAHRETVTGRVWGGCAEVLAINMMVGNSLIPQPEAVDGCVLALETSEQMPPDWYIEDFLTALGERGLLNKFSAVLVGRAKARNMFTEPGKKEREQYRKDQQDMIQTILKQYNPEAPIVFNMDFGHTDPVAPIPIGGTAHINVAEQQIRFS